MCRVWYKHFICHILLTTHSNLRSALFLTLISREKAESFLSQEWNGYRVGVQPCEARFQMLRLQHTRTSTETVAAMALHATLTRAQQSRGDAVPQAGPLWELSLAQRLGIHTFAISKTQFVQFISVQPDSVFLAMCSVFN